jgi:hypothetical protein
MATEEKGYKGLPVQEVANFLQLTLLFSQLNPEKIV